MTSALPVQCSTRTMYTRSGLPQRNVTFLVCATIFHDYVFFWLVAFIGAFTIPKIYDMYKVSIQTLFATLALMKCSKLIRFFFRTISFSWSTRTQVMQIFFLLFQHADFG